MADLVEVQRVTFARRADGILKVVGGVAARAGTSMAWQSELIKLFDEFEALLPPASFEEQVVVVAEKLSAEKHEYVYTQQVCVERFLSSVAVFNDGEEERGLLTPEGLQQRYFSGAELSGRKLGGGAVLKLRALIVAAVCIYKRAVAQDPECLSKFTARKLDHACQLLQQVMEVAQADESAAWIIYNGTVHIYEISRYALPRGLASTVLEFTLWAILMTESLTPLATVKYLPWRTQLYVIASKCYFEVGQSAHSLTLAERCLDNINTLESLEKMSDGVVDSSDVFADARLTIAQVVFRHQVWYTRKRRANYEVHKIRGAHLPDTLATEAEWPRNFVEDMLMKQFDAPDERLLAILEALSNNQRRTLNQCQLFSNDSPENHTVDRDTLARFADSASHLFTAGRDLCLRKLGTGDAKCDKNMLFFIQLAFNYEQNDVFHEITEVLLGQKSVFAVLNADRDKYSLEPPEDMPHATRLESRVTETHSRLITLLLTFAEARQTSKSKQTTLINAITCYPSTAPVPPRSKVRSAFPSKATAFANALEDILANSPDGFDQDLIHDAALFLWARCKAYYSKYNTPDEVFAAAAHFVDAETNEALPKYQTLRTVHHALTVCRSAISDPLVYGAITLKLSTFYVGLGAVQDAEAILATGIESVESYRSDRSQFLHPVCMVTTQRGLQTEHGESQSMELHNRVDGLVSSLELDLRIALWTVKLSQLDSNVLKSTSTKMSTKLITTPIAQQTKRRLGAARRGDAPAVPSNTRAAAWHDLAFCEPVAALIRGCGDDRVKLATLLSIVADKIGAETANKYKKALLVLDESVRLLTAAVEDTAPSCAAAGAIQEVDNFAAGTKAVMQPPVLLRSDRCQIVLRPPKVPKMGTAVFSVRVFGRQVEAAKSDEVVRMSDNKLSGTDITFHTKSSNLDIVIGGLEPNRHYIFSFAAYDAQGKIIGSLGATSRPYLTSNPLPPVVAWGRVVRDASAVGASHVIRACAQWVWSHFMSTDNDAASLAASDYNATVNMPQLKLASVPELLTFCQVIMQFVDETMASEAIFANEFVHSPSLQASQPLRLALCRQALVVAEVALTISDAAMAVHAISKGYSLLANFVYHGINSPASLRMLMYCQNSILAVLSLQLNQLPDTVTADSFFHMCACMSLYVTKALFKLSDLAAAERSTSIGVEILAALEKLRGSSEAKNKNKSKNGKDGREKSAVKLFGEHVASELQNCLAWLSSKHRPASQELKFKFAANKEIESMLHLYAMLCGKSGQLPEQTLKGVSIPMNHPRHLEMACKWILRAVELGQYTTALEWGREVIRQAAIKSEKPPHVEEPRKLSAVVRHSAPGTPRVASPKTSKQKREDAKLRANVLASEDMTEKEYDSKMSDLLQLRALIDAYLVQLRLHRKVRQVRRDFYKGRAKWIAQVHMLCGVAGVRQMIGPGGTGFVARGDTPYDSCAVRRACALDGYIYDLAPLSEQPLSFDSEASAGIAEALGSYRRSVVIAARSKSLVQVRNVSRMIFNLARLLGPLKGASDVVSALQLTVATAVGCFADVLSSYKASGRLLVESGKDGAGGNADMTLVRDFYALAVPICASTPSDGVVTGRYVKNLIDAGLTLLVICPREDFDAFYSPLELMVAGVNNVNDLALLQQVVQMRHKDIAPLSKSEEKMRKCRVALANGSTAAITPGTVKSPAQLCAKVGTPESIHTLGDLKFSKADVEGATKCWTEAAARLLSLSEDFETWVTGVARLSLVPKVGQIVQRQPLWAQLEAGAVLGKLAKYSYQEDVDKCIFNARLAAVFISHALLSCSGDGDWKTKDYTHGYQENTCPGVSFLDHAHAGVLETLLDTLQHTCTTLVHGGFALEALPALAVYELLANQACFDFTSSVLARVLRLEALAALGLFSNALALCSELVSATTSILFIDGVPLDTEAEVTNWHSTMQEALSHCKAGSTSPDTMAPAVILSKMEMSGKVASVYGTYLANLVQLAHANLVCAYAARLVGIPEKLKEASAKEAREEAAQRETFNLRLNLEDTLVAQRAKSLLAHAAEQTFTAVAASSRAEVHAAGLSSPFSKIFYLATAGRAQVAAIRYQYTVAVNQLDAALVFAEVCSEEHRIDVNALLLFTHLLSLAKLLQQAQCDDVCINRCDQILDLAQMRNYSGASIAVSTTRSMSKTRLGLDTVAIADLEANLAAPSRTVPIYVECLSLATLGDRYCGSGEYQKAMSAYAKVQTALDAYISLLFSASVSTLLEDTTWMCSHVLEVQLYAKVQVNMALADISASGCGDCTTSAKAVQVAKAVFADAPFVVTSALLGAVRAQRAAGNDEASAAALGELCAHIALTSRPGDDLRLLQAVCVELYKHHASKGDDAGSVAAILAAASATTKLQGIFQWQNTAAVAALDQGLLQDVACPTVALPLFQNVGVDTLLDGDLGNGDAALKQLVASLSPQALLKRRAELERVRHSTMFNETEASALQQLNTFIEAHVLQKSKTKAKANPKSTDVEGLFAGPPMPSAKEPTVCLVWWCESPGCSDISLYFVSYGTANSTVVRRSFPTDSIAALHTKVSLFATTSCSSGAEASPVLEAAALLSSGEGTSDDPSALALPGEAVGELAQLLNPAFGGQSSTPSVVAWLNKALGI